MIRRLSCSLCTFLALALAFLPVRAEDRAREVVPEVDAFYKFSDTTRLHLYGKLTEHMTANTTVGEVGAHLDFAHEPILHISLRDLDGASAQRYRYRLALERKITVAGVRVVPYAQGETLYDTRYDSWNRQIYQLGAEVELSKQWRIEPYMARQNDKVSASANVDCIGVTLKYYK